MKRPACTTKVSPSAVRSLLLLLLIAITSATVVHSEPFLHNSTAGPDAEENKLEWNDVCSDMDMSLFEAGKSCGSPLAEPCFNHSRCSTSPRSTIYVYDQACSLADSNELLNTQGNTCLDCLWRTAAKDLGLLAETYDTACVFVHVNQRTDEEPCAPRAPLWNGGANHMMVDLTDQTREGRPSVASSVAMEAAVNIRTCFYRSGYDISVPLAPKRQFFQLSTIPPSERGFFLAIKGTAYITKGARGSAERMSLLSLHDPANGIAIVMHCFENHGAHLLPENVEECSRLRSTYDDFTYDALLNSTFGLVPAGRSPASFRLGEVMSAGSIPVFVATTSVRPFREQIDWSAFSFTFAPEVVGPEMIRTLRAVPREELEEMQKKSLAAFWEMFSSEPPRYSGVAKNVLRILERRLGHHRV